MAGTRGSDPPSSGRTERKRAKKRPRRKPAVRSFSIYVVRLDPAVLGRKRFRDRNPDYVPGKPCVYVGMTGLAPDERFENHRRGYKCNRFVRDFGRHLMRRKYERLNPMTRDEAIAKEAELAEQLRRAGYAVWHD